MRLAAATIVFACTTLALGAQKMERPGIVNYTKIDAVVACGGATETGALERAQERRLQGRGQPGTGK